MIFESFFGVLTSIIIYLFVQCVYCTYLLQVMF